MSRFEPTAEERAAGSALLSYLRANGNKVTNEDFDDRPDLRCLVNDRAMGCEIVGLIPADMQQGMRTFANVMRRRKINVAKITIPIEPDMWMTKIIEAKWAKVQNYPQSTFTKDMSLLVHHPMLGEKDPVEYDDPKFVDGVMYGQAMATHGFANVFYWSGKNIYLLNLRDPSTAKVQPDLSDGYPAYVLWILSAGPGGLREEFENKSIPLQLPLDQVKHIKPLDPAYQGLSPKELQGDFRFRLGFDALPGNGNPSDDGALDSSYATRGSSFE